MCNINEEVGVASSPFGAASWAYCLECLQKPADPEVMFTHLYEDVSDRGEGLHEAVNYYYTFKDGQYLSWPDYVKLRRAAE